MKKNAKYILEFISASERKNEVVIEWELRPKRKTTRAILARGKYAVAKYGTRCVACEKLVDFTEDENDMLASVVCDVFASHVALLLILKGHITLVTDELWQSRIEFAHKSMITNSKKPNPMKASLKIRAILADFSDSVGVAVEKINAGEPGSVSRRRGHLGTAEMGGEA